MAGSRQQGILHLIFPDNGRRFQPSGALVSGGRMHRRFSLLGGCPDGGRKRMGFCPDRFQFIQQDFCAADQILVVRIEPEGDLVGGERFLDKTLQAEDLGGLGIRGNRFAFRLYAGRYRRSSGISGGCSFLSWPAAGAVLG